MRRSSFRTSSKGDGVPETGGKTRLPALGKWTDGKEGGKGRPSWNSERTSIEVIPSEMSKPIWRREEAVEPSRKE